MDSKLQKVWARWIPKMLRTIILADAEKKFWGFIATKTAEYSAKTRSTMNIRAGATI